MNMKGKAGIRYSASLLDMRFHMRVPLPHSKFFFAVVLLFMNMSVANVFAGDSYFKLYIKNNLNSIIKLEVNSGCVDWKHGKNDGRPQLQPMDTYLYEFVRASHCSGEQGQVNIFFSQDLKSEGTGVPEKQRRGYWYLGDVATDFSADHGLTHKISYGEDAENRQSHIDFEFNPRVDGDVDEILVSFGGPNRRTDHWLRPDFSTANANLNTTCSQRDQTNVTRALNGAASLFDAMHEDAVKAEFSNDRTNAFLEAFGANVDATLILNCIDNIVATKKFPIESCSGVGSYGAASAWNRGSKKFIVGGAIKRSTEPNHSFSRASGFGTVVHEMSHAYCGTLDLSYEDGSGRLDTYKNKSVPAHNEIADIADAYRVYAEALWLVHNNPGQALDKGPTGPSLCEYNGSC
jgi:hypothetical protein